MTKLAYEDESFLDGDAARPVRILSEYLAPLSAFERARVRDTVAFFGSARTSETGPMANYDDARELARRVTEWSSTLPEEGRRLLVCSGGGGGIMEAANRGAMDAGGP